MLIRRLSLFFTVFALLLLGLSAPAHAKGTIAHLTSWNDGATKQTITNFVTKAVTPESDGYIPPHLRIAVFDNDGTLLPERPYAQIDFAVQRLREMAKNAPDLMDKEPYKTALSNDISHMEKVGSPFLLELLLTTHGNMEKEDLAPLVKNFMATAKHPLLGKTYGELAYKPMLELLDYLRANGFSTFICTGGTTDFVRAYALELYGIPPQNVIGTSFRMELTQKDGRSVLWVKPELNAYNDKTYKPVAIDSHIGLRPVITVGNVYSGGDVAMLSYGASHTQSPSLQLLLHHDDAARELAYDEPNNVSLTAAREQGWTVISMKKDWSTIFGGK